MEYLKINSKNVSLMKAVKNANYRTKTALTNSSWEFVSLWLRRDGVKKNKNAIFYWEQAQYFYEASKCLPINSRPLTAYYCCLNATKALLSLQDNIDLENISHGVCQDRRKNAPVRNLKDEKVIFQGSGVLFELSKYLNESIAKTQYTIKDLLFNIPCVHRAYNITYSDGADLFIPIKNLHFVKPTKDTLYKSWIQFSVDEKYNNKYNLRYLPAGYEKTPDNFVRKKNARFSWNSHTDLKSRLSNLKRYHEKVRKDIHYIYGDAMLWYIKKENDSNSHIIPRNSLTLIYPVMHWLSELVRYNPQKFTSYMNTNQNWLLVEFIETSLIQYIDIISCEITGTDIMVTGYKK